MSNFKFLYTNNNKISQIFNREIMINQLKTTDLDEDLIEVHLRLKEKKQSIKLIKNSTKVIKDESNIKYMGNIDTITYSINFKTILDICYVDVEVTNINEKYDLIFTMDIGLGEEAYLNTNEAYASQYLNHEIVENEGAKHICMRKSLEQNGKNPFLQLGSLNNIKSYSTDGYQFFKTQYRDKNDINALSQDDLDGEVYQYEFAFIALQSNEFNSDTKETFYFKYVEDSTQYAKDEFDLESVKAEYANINDVDSESINKELKDEVKILPVKELSNDEIKSMYKINKQVETSIEGKILSFFTKNESHVVTKEKEINMERNHGNIISDVNNMKILQNSFSSTNYMMGVFATQNVVGNTTFNQLLTPCRNSLNVEKTSGLRIYVIEDGKRFLLGTPSLYEIGLNYSKWIYKLENDILEISTYIKEDKPKQKFEIKSQNNINYTIEIGIDIEDFLDVKEEDDMLSITPKEDTFTMKKCPKLKYEISYKGTIRKDDDISNHYYVKLNEMDFYILGNLYGDIEEIKKSEFLTLEEENNNVYNVYKSFLNNFNLQYKDDEKINKFNTQIVWYLHNALIHFASPRGLEQYKGAAWGTRDVLQGPFELFMSLQKYDKVGDILRLVYKSQFFEDGNWSQWFMFDQYQEVAANESHGDVIVWPLKALANYIDVTNDLSILDVEVEYKQRDKDFEFTNEKYKIIDHVKKQLEYIKTHLVKNTNLPSYGDGDWDDTLQPKEDSSRKTMVSGWTSALLFETLDVFTKKLKEYDSTLCQELEEFNNKLKDDYYKYIIKDGIPAGFINYEDEVEYLLHPLDKKTSIKYRLLPLNRGIISELFNEEHISNVLKIVDEHLRCEDGIRLMDKPAPYKEGFNTLFQRAEQASTVGREVGLQYVHAHIRFVEAMAKIGKKDEVLNGLNKISPIDLDLHVKNAMYKQRNSYFSSSEGNFKSRYDYAENFGKLRNGTIGIKTGWRIYSSGPGIYVNQLLSNYLGIKIKGDNLIFDPCIEDKYDGMTFEYKLFGYDIKIVYTNEIENKILINGKNMEVSNFVNKYKDDSIQINIEEFKKNLDSDKVNEIKIKF